eukprot:Nk52_evm26s255 gene=Nk52_evmTU26s255
MMSTGRIEGEKEQRSSAEDSIAAPAPGGCGGDVDVDASTCGVLKPKPACKHFNPINVQLQRGQTKMWCACGLSSRQPWCDGKSHKGTGISPVKFTAGKSVRRDKKTEQNVGEEEKEEDKANAAISETGGLMNYSMCVCKYSQAGPLCDGSHIDLPLKYMEQIRSCPSQHPTSLPGQNPNLCSGCGWFPDVEDLFL